MCKEEKEDTKSISTHLHVFPNNGSGVGPGTSLYGRTFSTRLTAFGCMSTFSTKFCAWMHVLAVSICFIDCVVVAIFRTMQFLASRPFLSDFILNILLFNTNCFNLQFLETEKTKIWINVRRWSMWKYRFWYSISARSEHLAVTARHKSIDCFMYGFGGFFFLLVKPHNKLDDV